MIYDKYKLIQIAIPRTATVSTFNAIHKFSPHHRTPNKHNKIYGLNSKHINENNPLYEYYKHGHVKYVDYKKFISKNEQYKDYKIFSFVRNPYDRLVSAFYFFIVDKQRGADNKETFKNYILSTIGNKEGILSQTEYLINDEGKIDLDFIGRFEEYENSWKLLQKINPELPEYNKNSVKTGKSNRPNKSLMSYYTDEIKEIVTNNYHDDFINFGYKK